MKGPRSSKELQRWTAEVGEAVYRERWGSLTSDLWGSWSCGTICCVIASMFLVDVAGVAELGDGSMWMYALFGGFFMVAAVACWACTLSYWRKRRSLSPTRPPVTVDSAITDDDRLTRTVTIGPVGERFSKSWKETTRLPEGEEAAAVVARHAIEDAGWKEAVSNGTLPRSTSDDGASRRDELRALLREGRALPRRTSLESGREEMT